MWCTGRCRKANNRSVCGLHRFNGDLDEILIVGIFTQTKQFIATVTDNKSLLHPKTTALSLDEMLKMLNNEDEERIVEENDEENFFR